MRWRHALIGGLFVATCMVGGKRVLAAYFGAVPTYAMIYGAFATLPIFLVWIYLTWVIILLGAVIAAYAPLIGRKVARWPDTPGSDFHLALIVVAQLDAARRDGRRGRTADDIAAAIGIDPLQVDPVLEALIELDWVGRLEEFGSARYVLLCDPATTLAEPLLRQAAARPRSRARDDVEARRLRCRSPRRADRRAGAERLNRLRSVTACRRSAARRSGRRGVPRGAIRRSRR